MQDYIKQMSAAVGTLPEAKKAEVAGLLDLLSAKMDDIASYKKIRHYFQDTACQGIESQLNAIDKRTDVSADAIMTAAEAIVAIVSQDTRQADADQKVMEQVNKIFEACSFQDLVAQHTHEVRRLILPIENELQNNAGADALTSTENSLEQRRKLGDSRPDSNLMNGPTTDI
jgi:chemotaxis protein CheZ